MTSTDGYTIPLRKLIGLILAVGLALSWVFTLFGFTADRYLFRPSPYLDALDQFRFAELFPRLVAEMIVQTEPPSDPLSDPPGRLARPGNQIKYLGVDDYEIILTGLMPQDWIRTETRGVITQIFDVLNLETDDVELSISLVEVKSNLSGPQGDEIALRMIRSWPACTLDWIGQVTTLAINGELEGFPTCQPPDEFLSLIQPVIRGSLFELAESLPDRVDLVRALQNVRSSEFRFDQLPAVNNQATGPVLPISYQIFRWAIRLSPLLTVWLLAMLTLVTIRSWRELIVWWGMPALIAGGLSLLLSLIAGLPLYSTVSERLTESSAGIVTANFAQIFLLSIQVVIQRYLLWVGIFAGLLTLVSGGLILLSQIPSFRQSR